MSAPSWSRYGSQQRRICARAGCNAPAVATLRFQPTERQAWLAELDESAARTQGDLCHRHASALVLPRGWELHDERRPVTGPVESAAPAEADSSSAGEPRQLPIPMPRNAAVPDAVDEADEAGASDGTTRAVPAQFGSSDAEGVDDALDSILDARTPLLQRAFRNARPT